MGKKAVSSVAAAKKRVHHALAAVERLVENQEGWTIAPIDTAIDLTRALSRLAALQTPLVEDASPIGLRLAALWDWSRERGATSPAATLALEAVAAEGNGIVAKRAIPAGELVLAVPTAAMLSCELGPLSASGASHWFATEFARARARPLQPTIRLSFSLLAERLMGDGSVFAPYVRTLPERYDVPLYWGPAALRLLRGAATERKAVGQLRVAANMYVEIRSFLAQHPCPGVPLSEFTWPLWRWATAAVVSRQNAVPLPGDGEEGLSAAAAPPPPPPGSGAAPPPPPQPRTVLALVPVWDLCNHASGECTSVFDVASRSIELRTMAAVGPGDQVRIYYGERPSSELVIYQGFIPDGPNGHDTVALQVPVASDDPLLPLKNALLRRVCGVAVTQTPDDTGAAVTLPCALGHDGAARPALSAAVQILCADKPAVAAMLRGGDLDHVLRVGPAVGDAGPAAPRVGEAAARVLAAAACAAALERLDDARRINDVANAAEAEAEAAAGGAAAAEEAARHVGLAERLVAVERKLLESAVALYSAA